MIGLESFMQKVTSISSGLLTFSEYKRARSVGGCLTSQLKPICESFNCLSPFLPAIPIPIPILSAQPKQSIMDSWVSTREQPEFSLQNLPYGIFSTKSDSTKRIGVAIGSHVLDLKVLAQKQVFDTLGIDTRVLQETTLNSYAALGRQVQRKVTGHLRELLRVDTSLGHVLRDDVELRRVSLVPMADAQMHLPMDIGDYTDFFTSPYHAQNVRSDLRLRSPWCLGNVNLIRFSPHHLVHKHRQTRYTIATELLEHPSRLPRTRIFHSGVWNPYPTATRLSHAGWRADLRTQPETGL